MELSLHAELGSNTLSPVKTNQKSTKAAEPTDNELIRLVARGDRDAFTVIYQRYSRRVGGYLWKMLRDHDLVDEALNDTMMVVWTKAGDFNFQSRLSTWMLGIAHNKGLKLLAKRTRRQTVEATEATPELLVDHDTPAKVSARDDVIRALLQALDKLSIEHRTAIELTFYEGLSYSEIAEIVDCPVNTVKTRVFHARKQLTRHLAEQGLDTDSNEHLDIS